jgi:hypothetical protein
MAKEAMVKIFSTSRHGETSIVIDDDVNSFLLVAAVYVRLYRSDILAEVSVIILESSWTKPRIPYSIP